MDEETNVAKDIVLPIIVILVIIVIISFLCNGGRDLTDEERGKEKYETQSSLFAADDQNAGIEQNDKPEQKNEKKEFIRLVYSETKNASQDLNVAVAAVVMNRVTNPNFPNTILDVIYQPSQFRSVYSETLVEYENIPEDARKQVENAVDQALAGIDPTNRAYFYYIRAEKSTDENISIITRIGNVQIDGWVFLKEFPY